MGFLRMQSNSLMSTEASDRLLKLTLDALPDQIAVLDEDGTILTVNAAWKRFAVENGAHPEAVSEGVNYFRVCESSGDAEDVLQGMHAVLEGSSDLFSIEYPCDSSDEERWFVVRVCRLEEEGLRRLVVIHENLSSRKQHMLAELRKNEQRFRMVCDITRLGVWEHDLVTGEIMRNKYDADLFGLAPDDYEPTHEAFMELVHPEDKAMIEEAVTRTIEDGVVVGTEYRVLSATGEIHWLTTHARTYYDDDGTPLRMLGVTRNITERKQAAAAIETSEQRFRALAENVPGVIYLCENDEAYTILYVNDVIESLTGYRRDDYLERRISYASLIHEEDRSFVYLSIQDAVAQRRPFHVQYRIRRSTGETRWIEEWGAGVYENDELMHLEGYLMDVTARKTMLQQLEETAYNLRKAQEIAQLGSFALDIESPENDVWSEEMYHILGRSPKAPPVPNTEYVRKIVHSQDRYRIAAAFSQSIEQGTPLDLEYRILHPDQSLRFVHLRAEALTNRDGIVSKIAGTLQDITSQKLAEIELQKTSELTNAILNTTLEGIITISERGAILTFNEAAEQIFGYSSDEIVGQNVNRLMPPPYSKGHNDYIADYISTGQRKIIGIEREVVGRRKDGSFFPMEIAVSEILLDDRRFFAGLVRDISERRKMELEILKISDYERQTIGQELHDGLGSQLSGITMVCQSIARQLDKSGLELAGEVAEIAAEIKEADYQARNIARGLVPVSEDPHGLRQALIRLAKTAPRTYGVECRFEENEPVKIDDYSVSGHLYRIAQEAFSNAVRHGKCSRVTIRLNLEENGSVQLDIIDDGKGIPDKLPDDRGVGLRTMQYRANVIGGQLTIRRGKKKGTVVSCLIRRYH